MRIIIGLVLLLKSSLGFSYCKGREVHYKDGKVLEFKSEQEYERGAKYINRLDYYEAKFDGKNFIISKDGIFKVGDVEVRLPEKQFKYTDFYSITKIKGKYFLRMGFDDGVDILVFHLVEIDLKNKKTISVWTEPCGHWKTYISVIDNKLTYMCEYYCDKMSKDKVNSAYQYMNKKWNLLKNDKLCKNFGKHKEIKFIGFKRVLVKDKNGKRFITEWIKPDKTECILPKPVSDEEVKRKMKEDAKMIEEFYKQKSKNRN